MKKHLLLLFIISLLCLCFQIIPTLAATTSVQLGNEVLSVFEGRPLNVINISNKNVYLPSYADENQVATYLTDQKTKVTLHQSKNLPTLFLQTRSKKETFIHRSKENKETGAFLLVDEKGETLGIGELDQIRIRGNSTRMYKKKAYQIKLKEKSDLLGMGKARTWVLLANVIDGSMLRNDLALRLAAAVGLPYTSSCAFVDLYLNGNYKGNYLLCEKVQIHKQRIDIPDLEKENEAVNSAAPNTYGYAYGTMKNAGTILEILTVDGRAKHMKNIPGWKDLKPGGWTARSLESTPEDYTGGYLIESGLKDNFKTSSRFLCDSGWKLIVKEPEDSSVKEVTYIFRIFQQIDRAMTEGNWKALKKLIDTDNWARRYVFEEVLANFDAGARSAYFYKDSDTVDTKVHFAPVWDYDNCLGISIKMKDPEIFYLQDTETAHINFPYDIFLRLTKIPEFMELVKTTYREVFRPLLADLLEEKPAEKLESIRARSELISASRSMNYKVWKHYHESRLTEIGDSEKECLDFLLDFLKRRVAFLDIAWAE